MFLQSISIHAPPRGATGKVRVIATPHIHFNSRPSARGDHAQPCMEGLFFISIHAPPRGATFQRCSVGDEWKISIHAPPRGATGINTPDDITKHFNSRPSARGDEVNIYGAVYHRHFNSRPSARGDYAVASLDAVTQHFNSRPSARGDPAAERRKIMAE